MRASCFTLQEKHLEAMLTQNILKPEVVHMLNDCCCRVSRDFMRPMQWI